MHRVKTLLVAAVAAAGVLGALAQPASASPTRPSGVPTHNRTDIGLYGKSDPSFDGVFRQSLALLAEATVGTHDQAAIGWLVNQQCPDGGWTAYRETLNEPCPATDLNKFTGEDSNSTAIAIEALHALGVTPKYDALAFLHTLQDSDGGFSDLAGSGSDPNSTGLVAQALRAVGQDPSSPAWTKNGKSAVDGLLSFWLNCGSSDPGAFASPYSKGHGDLVASVQAVWGAAGQPFPISGPPGPTHPTPDCSNGALTPTDTETAGYAASWVAGKIQGAGYLTTGSSPDASLTAQGILAMAASGTNATAADQSLTYLRDNIKTAVLDSHGNLSPGTLGYLALAVHALGKDPAKFAGHNLIADITSTRRTLQSSCVNCSGGSVGSTHRPPVENRGGVPRAAGGGQHALPMTGRNIGAQTAAGFGASMLGCLLLVAGRRRRPPGRHRAT